MCSSLHPFPFACLSLQHESRMTKGPEEDMPPLVGPLSLLRGFLWYKFIGIYPKSKMSETKQTIFRNITRGSCPPIIAVCRHLQCQGRCNRLSAFLYFQPPASVQNSFSFLFRRRVASIVDFLVPRREVDGQLRSVSDAKKVFCGYESSMTENFW